MIGLVIILIILQIFALEDTPTEHGQTVTGMGLVGALREVLGAVFAHAHNDKQSEKAGLQDETEQSGLTGQEMREELPEREISDNFCL